MRAQTMASIQMLDNNGTDRRIGQKGHMWTTMHHSIASRQIQAVLWQDRLQETEGWETNGDGADKGGKVDDRAEQMEEYLAVQEQAGDKTLQKEHRRRKGRG